MKISAKTEYACIAVLELAKNQGSSEPVRIRNIAEQHRVPPRFLVQILLQLKGAGIVSSTRGASGGYHLIPKPEEVTLGQVMTIIDGPVQASKRSGNAATQTTAVGVLENMWETAEQKRQDYLKSVTFADIIKKVEKMSEVQAEQQETVSHPAVPTHPVQHHHSSEQVL